MLLTQELKDRFLKVGDQRDESDPIIVAHFFNPGWAWDWYAFSYDDVDQIFVWYVSIFRDRNDECWSFSLQELQNYRWPLGLGIERDRFWKEIPFSSLKKYWDE